MHHIDAGFRSSTLPFTHPTLTQTLITAKCFSTDLFLDDLKSFKILTPVILNPAYRTPQLAIIHSSYSTPPTLLAVLASSLMNTSLLYIRFYFFIKCCLLMVMDQRMCLINSCCTENVRSLGSSWEDMQLCYSSTLYFCMCSLSASWWETAWLLLHFFSVWIWNDVYIFSLFLKLLKMSGIKRIVPRLQSMAFKMKFQDLVNEIKPVWLCAHLLLCLLFVFAVCLCFNELTFVPCFSYVVV